MRNQSDNKPLSSRRRSLLIAFLLGGIGLLLLNEAADSVRLHPINLLVLFQILLGLGCLGLALWQGTKRT